MSKVVDLLTGGDLYGKNNIYHNALIDRKINNSRLLTKVEKEVIPNLQLDKNTESHPWSTALTNPIVNMVANGLLIGYGTAKDKKTKLMPKAQQPISIGLSALISAGLGYYGTMGLRNLYAKRVRKQQMTDLTKVSSIILNNIEKNAGIGAIAKGLWSATKAIPKNLVKATKDYKHSAEMVGRGLANEANPQAFGSVDKYISAQNQVLNSANRARTTGNKRLGQVGKGMIIPAAATSPLMFLGGNKEEEKTAGAKALASSAATALKSLWADTKMLPHTAKTMKSNYSKLKEYNEAGNIAGHQMYTKALKNNLKSVGKGMILPGALTVAGTAGVALAPNHGFIAVPNNY